MAGKPVPPGYALGAVKAIRQAIDGASDMARCRYCRRRYVESPQWRARTTSCGSVRCRMAEEAAP